MQISSITNRINSPSFSGFHYNSGKKVYRDLNERIDKFEYNPNNRNLAELLNAELKVLEEELANPEQYLDEAKQGGAMDSAILKKPKKIQEIQLKINALNGIYNTLYMGSNLNLSIDISNSLKQSVKNIIISGSEETPSDQKLKLYALKSLKYFYNDLNSEEKEKINAAIAKTFENSPSKTNKKMAFDILSKNLDKNSIIYKELLNTAIKEAKVENLAKIINDEKADYDLRNKAIWAAGKTRNTDNFKSLLNILNQNYFGPDQKEYEKLNFLKETALSSLALYYDKNEYKKTVKESLEKYAYSDSDISRDANALLKKIQGKNNSEDLYINELLPEHSREAYKYLRSKYIDGIRFLDNEQKNRIDKALIPMFKPLSGLVNKGARFVVIKNNSVTSIFKEDIGVRSTDGRFCDSFPGCAKGKIAASLLSGLNIDYIVAHECNHAFVMNVIKEEDKNQLIRLYHQAKEHKRFLDDYSAKDYLEYFAVGYEAYLRTCESHSNIKNRDSKNSSSHSHTYLSLKYKDPDLYNFIECCLRKYDKNSYGDIYKKLDKVA